MPDSGALATVGWRLHRVLVLPMIPEDEGSAGDGGEHRYEGADHERFGVRDDLGEAAMEK